VPPVAFIIAGIVFHTSGVETAIINIDERKEAGIVTILVLFTSLIDPEFTVVMGAIRSTGTPALRVAGTPFILDRV
jgi:hypothetical protein